MPRESPSPHQDAVDLADEILTIYAGEGELTVPDHHYGAIIALILLITKYDNIALDNNIAYDIVHKRTPVRFKGNKHYAILLDKVHQLKVAA